MALRPNWDADQGHWWSIPSVFLWKASDSGVCCWTHSLFMNLHWIWRVQVFSLLPINRMTSAHQKLVQVNMSLGIKKQKPTGLRVSISSLLISTSSDEHYRGLLSKAIVIFPCFCHFDDNNTSLMKSLKTFNISYVQVKSVLFFPANLWTYTFQNQVNFNTVELLENITEYLPELMNMPIYLWVKT